jgi:hypothetical protein
MASEDQPISQRVINPEPIDITVCDVCGELWEAHTKLVLKRAKSAWDRTLDIYEYEPMPEDFSRAFFVNHEDCIKLLLTKNQGPEGPTGPMGAPGAATGCNCMSLYAGVSGPINDNVAIPNSVPYHRHTIVTSPPKPFQAF